MLPTTELSPPQQVFACLLNGMIGETINDRPQFEKHFNPVKRKAPSLLSLSFKSLLDNADLSLIKEKIDKCVEGQRLSFFCDYHIAYPAEIVKHIIKLADNTGTNRIKVLIGKEDFSINAARMKLWTCSFSDDMVEPATHLADITGLLFQNSNFNIEFSFDAGMKPGQFWDLSPKHILLLQKLRARHFSNFMLRENRLTIGMVRVDPINSELYYQAICQLFENYQPLLRPIPHDCAPPRTYPVTYHDVLQYTFRNPDHRLVSAKEAYGSIFEIMYPLIATNTENWTPGSHMAVTFKGKKTNTTILGTITNVCAEKENAWAKLQFTLANSSLLTAWIKNPSPVDIGPSQKHDSNSLDAINSGFATFCKNQLYRQWKGDQPPTPTGESTKNQKTDLDDNQRKAMADVISHDFAE